MSFLRFAVVAWLCFAPAQLFAFVEHISPPGIEKGKTTRVTFVGSDLANAIDVWSSLPLNSFKAKAIESTSDRAVFDIEVSKDAPVGTFGVRVATRDGLGNAHLFLIDDLPMIQASESMTLKLPVAVWGNFREAEIDRFRIDVKAGQTVSFEVVGSRFGKDADPLITIRNAQGKWITERDNDQGLYYDSRFTHTFAEAGTYIVELRDSRFRGSPHQTYVLRMGRFPAERVAVPAAIAPKDANIGPFFQTIRRPDDEGSSWLPVIPTTLPITVARDYDYQRAKAQELAASPATMLAFRFTPWVCNPFATLDTFLPTGRAQPTPAKVPGVLCGTLKQPNERHTFMLELMKGQQIHVRAESQPLNSPLYLDVVLTDHVGREVRRGNDVAEPMFEFTTNNPGIYGLRIRDRNRDGGESFAYRITVSESPFPPSIVAEVEGLTIPQGTYQPMPLTITRTGTTGPIKLKLLNAPPGVKITPDEIGDKDNTILCKLEADAGTPIGVSSIQILAETSSGPVLVRTQPLIDKQLINVDLILHALREDQRRLPPSLSDRFALQIVPASPFTMELPESLVTLARYQRVEFPIVTTRVSGFDTPITFVAKGGQLADKSEGRTRVYAEFPDATPAKTSIRAGIQSKILTNLAKTRIEVTGTGIHQGRKIQLTRAFELNITTAFTLSSESPKVALLPGESTKAKLMLTRLPTFEGEVMLRLSPMQNVEFPETLLIPKGQSSVELPIVVSSTATPRNQRLTIHATGTVEGYEEELRVEPIEIEVKKVEPVKKK